MSVTPDVTERLVAPLSSRITTATFQQKGAKYDLSVDDLPFLLAPTQQNPYVRQTAQSQRQQVDTSAEPGEQTLSQWWTRSQDSWHRGAGIGFYEPGTTANNIYRFDATTANRFSASVGIDPWTKGQITMLKKTGSTHVVTAGQSAFVTGGISGGTDVVYTVENGTVKRWDGASTVTSYSTSSGGTPATAVVRAGSSLLVGTTTGISVGSSTGSAMTSLWTIASGAIDTPYWVKSRIIAARGASLYELTLATGGAIPLAGAMAFTHPDTAWTWTGVAEAPTAILASGYSNGQGAIYRFKLVDGTATGASPTIGAGEVVAEFPPGEEVTAIYSYLGTFLGIGTSKGFRVGTLQSDGGVSYGPLLFTTTKPVRAITARDRFFYAAVEAQIDGSTGCYRIDLDEQIEEGRFPYASDFQTHDTGVPSSITFLGNSDRVVVAVPSKGIYVQSATLYEASGWITSGKIRFASSVGKIFTLAQIRGSATSTSTIRVATVVDGVENSEFTIGQAFNTDADISLSTSSKTLPNLEMKLTFGSSNDRTVTPVVDTLTVKALPQVRVQRTIQYPISLFDLEQDRNGVRVGGPGSAWGRLQALEDKESSKVLCSFTDTRTGETFRGWIVQVSFQVDVAPAKGFDSYGGFLMLTVMKM